VTEPTFWMCDVTNVQQKAGQSSGTSWTYFESLWAEDNCRRFAPLIYISEVLSSGHGSGSGNFGRKVFWTVLNPSSQIPGYLTLWGRNYFFNFSTLCIWNVNNTGMKEVSIVKQTAFWREKNGEYRACLKYSVPIVVE